MELTAFSANLLSHLSPLAKAPGKGSGMGQIGLLCSAGPVAPAFGAAVFSRRQLFANRPKRHVDRKSSLGNLSKIAAAKTDEAQAPGT